MAFPLFLGFRYQNYTGKAIFMPLSIGVGIDFSKLKNNVQYLLEKLHYLFILYLFCGGISPLWG
jgi:hypothetical protein